MKYVERNQDGSIKGIFANPQQGYAEEMLPDDNPEVIAFYTQWTNIEQTSKKRSAAIAALIEELLAQRALQPDAPQVLKDYVAEVVK